MITSDPWELKVGKEITLHCSGEVFIFLAAFDFLNVTDVTRISKVRLGTFQLHVIEYKFQ